MKNLTKLDVKKIFRSIDQDKLFTGIDISIQKFDIDSISMVLLRSVRSLDYMDLPKLYFLSDPINLFYLGYYLVSLAKFHSSEGGELSSFSLGRHKNSSIGKLLLDIRPAYKNRTKISNVEHAKLSSDFFWLAPLRSDGLKSIDLPVAGLINGSVCGISNEVAVHNDRSTAYLGCNVTGAFALGRKIMVFAILNDAESISFEHDHFLGGVGPCSYEMEFVKKSSFAGESLLL